MLLLEDSSFEAINLGTPLVPLERMQSLWQLRSKAALDVVVNAKISFDKVIEIMDYLIGVLVKKSLQLAHLLIVIEVLLVLRIELIEDGMVVFESLNQLILSSLLG